MITVTSQDQDIQRERQRIASIKGGFEKAFYRAANRAAKTAKSQMSKEIRKHVLVKKEDLDTQIKVEKHKKGSSVSLKETERLPLKYFAAKQTRAGVSYRNAAKGKRPVVPGAFIVYSLGGHAFTRVGAKVIATKGRYKGKKRQRIAKLYGASAWGAFVVNRMYLPIKADIGDVFLNRLRHEVNYILMKAAQNNG